MTKKAPSPVAAGKDAPRQLEDFRQSAATESTGGYYPLTGIILIRLSTTVEIIGGYYPGKETAGEMNLQQ